jgi:hypothetical protein
MGKKHHRRGKSFPPKPGLIKSRPEKRPRRARKPARMETLCDCGNMAVERVRVTIGVPGESLTRISIPLCADCLEIERETQRLLDELGRKG